MSDSKKLEDIKNRLIEKFAGRFAELGKEEPPAPAGQTETPVAAPEEPLLPPEIVPPQETEPSAPTEPSEPPAEVEPPKPPANNLVEFHRRTPEPVEPSLTEIRDTIRKGEITQQFQKLSGLFDQYLKAVEDRNLDEQMKIKELLDAERSSLPPPTEIEALNLTSAYEAFREKSEQTIQQVERFIQEQEDKLRTPPKNKKQILNELDAAREKFAKAEQKINDYSRVKEILHGHIAGESLQKLEVELAQAQVEYKKLRAELMASSVEKLLEERGKFTEAKIQAYQQSHAQGALGKAYDWYKKLSRFNVVAGLNKFEPARAAIEQIGASNTKLGKLGKFGLRGLKVINARTAISFGLLGVGIWAGAGSAVGIGAIATRRYLAGISSGVGTYDLIDMAASRLKRRKLENYAEKEDLNYITEDLARLESRAVLDGKSMESLKQDPVYQKMLKTYEKQMAQAQLAGNLDAAVQEADKDLKQAFKEERNSVRVKKIIAGTAGAIVGSTIASGAFANFLKNKMGAGERAIEQPEPLESPIALKTPEIPASEQPPLEPGEVQAPKISAVEPGTKVNLAEPVAKAPSEALAGQAKDFVVNANDRGIEGALLDLKNSNPEKYQSMVKWLEENYSSKTAGGNTPDKLIHRFVLDYATDHDLNPAKLDEIMKAEITLKADGSLDIADNQIEYVSEPAGIKTGELTDEANARYEADKAAREELISKPAAAPAVEAPKAPEVPVQKEVDQILQSNVVKFHAPESVDNLIRSHMPLADSLKELAGSQYQDFLQHDLMVTPEDLREIETMSIDSFLRYAEEGATLNDNRFKLLEYLVRQGLHDGGTDHEETMKSFVLRFAEAYYRKAA